MPLSLPAKSTVAVFGDQYVFMRMMEGEPQVGLWPSKGGKPTQDFQAIPEQSGDGMPVRGPTPSDFVGLVLLAAVVMLVFWRRQESVAYPVPLPAGVMVAGLGRRGLAALIDMLPAALIVGWWWHGPIQEFLEAFRNTWPTPEQFEAMGTPKPIIWAWIWFRVIYTAWCLGFELALSATPGKLLLGCQVRSESLSRPNAVQIVIRNVMRLVELEPHLMIWPFVLVLFLTRNRQRIGDLLAKTVVLEGQVAILDQDRETPAETEEKDEQGQP
jgi:uncharacterized RDD family membrane protein YckC